MTDGTLSSPANNPFSATQDPTNVVQGCHRCQCDKVFAEAVKRVLRVRDVCKEGNVCELDTYDIFRKRNMAVSQDYARVFFAPGGNRLKFAGAAALGSTLAGFGMDIIRKNLITFGDTIPGQSKDGVNLSDGTTIVENEKGNLADVGEFLSGLSWEQMRTGLRRLSYGNLAIYMDLGLVVNFCQLHEERFGYFRDERVDEFLECWDKFVEYVKNEHATDHPVYDPVQGSFGNSSYVRDAVEAIAKGHLMDSLEIIDHEQRVIAQQGFYKVEPLTSSVPNEEKQAFGSDDDFKVFMNALEQVEHNRFMQIGADIQEGFAASHGIYAAFSADRSPHLLWADTKSPAGTSLSMTAEQPLIHFYPGGDFTDPDNRTPWFKDVMKLFLQAEDNLFPWPTVNLLMGGRHLMRLNGQLTEVPIDTKKLLYAEIRRAGRVV